MFRNMLRKFIVWAMNSSGPDIIRSDRVDSTSPLRDSETGMNFNVLNAVGGKVVQFSTYDPVRDRRIVNLYIVHDKEDLGEQIGYIITKESLTR